MRMTIRKKLIGCFLIMVFFYLEQTYFRTFPLHRSTHRIAIS